MLLRHKPAAAGLTLSSEGWCSLEELFKKTDFTLNEIQEIVRADEKQRYSLTALHIRANPAKFISIYHKT